MDETGDIAERLAEVTIGELNRIDGPIHLADPDPAWPGMFEREAARIRSALGTRVLLLEHVGSTSVPGLTAKPIIDIVLAVADSADEQTYVPDLEAAGYTLRIREPEWHQHRLLKGTSTSVHLHVFTKGSSEITRMLAFRNRLRSSPADLDRYAEAKHTLAARRWRYGQEYADAKSAVIEDILTRAAPTESADE